MSASKSATSSSDRISSTSSGESFRLRRPPSKISARSSRSDRVARSSRWTLAFTSGSGGVGGVFAGFLGAGSGTRSGRGGELRVRVLDLFLKGIRVLFEPLTALDHLLARRLDPLDPLAELVHGRVHRQFGGDAGAQLGDGELRRRGVGKDEGVRPHGDEHLLPLLDVLVRLQRLDGGAVLLERDPQQLGLRAKLLQLVARAL